MTLYRVLIRTTTDESLVTNKQNYTWVLVESKQPPDIDMVELVGANLMPKSSQGMWELVKNKPINYDESI